MRTLLMLSLMGLAAFGQQQVNYAYDPAGRLIRADYGGGKVISYSYDAAGNLLKRDIATEPVFTSVSSASLKLGPVAADLIASGYGAGLATGTAVAVTNPPPLELAGTRVDVTDRQGVTRRAGLFYVSPTQINYLVPEGTANGAAQVRVTPAAGGAVNGTLDVQRIAPGIYTANFSGAGVAAAFYLRIAGDGSRTQGLLFNPNTLASIPVELGGSGDGLYLLLFGTGVRGHQGNVTATVGGLAVPVLGAVPQGEFPGEDQINIGPLPRSLAGRGEVDIVLTFDGVPANVSKVNLR